MSADTGNGRPRYAIFYAPPLGDPLAVFGARWLGRDVVSGQPVAQPRIDGLDMPAITAFPRHYGLHATLKAPFALAEGATPEALIDSVRDFAAEQRTAAGPDRKVAVLGRFVAIVPDDASPRIDDLAAAAVERFEPFRAPLDAAEMAKRLASNLTDRQRALLDRWGYPYVFDQFRVHMTLSGPLDDQTRQAVRLAAQTAAAPFLEMPFTVDRLAVFHQPDRETPFREIAGFSLAP